MGPFTDPNKYPSLQTCHFSGSQKFQLKSSDGNLGNILKFYGPNENASHSSSSGHRSEKCDLSRVKKRHGPDPQNSNNFTLFPGRQVRVFFMTSCFRETCAMTPALVGRNGSSQFEKLTSGDSEVRQGPKMTKLHH